MYLCFTYTFVLALLKGYLYNAANEKQELYRFSDLYPDEYLNFLCVETC